MTAPQQPADSLYALAEAANDRVTVTLSAYQKATRDRDDALCLLQDSGQSLYAISKRLGLSTARVAQIVARAKARREHQPAD